jgi:hypothetical protein
MWGGRFYRRPNDHPGLHGQFETRSPPASFPQEKFAGGPRQGVSHEGERCKVFSRKQKRSERISTAKRRDSKGSFRRRRDSKESLRREACRDSRPSVHGADEGVPVETRGSVRGRFIIRERLLQPQKGAGGRHRSRTNRSRFTATSAWRTRCIGMGRPKRMFAKAAFSPHPETRERAGVV